MAKKNKIRYTSSPKQFAGITLSGNVYLQYRDEESAENIRGDLLVFAECKQLHTNHFAAYDRTGFTGYFKVDVHDGKEWQPVILNEIFEHREQHFSRTERPIDTFNLCYELLTALKGRMLSRTYREHYELAPAPEEE
ncbi:MAG: hypothetical protein SFX19_04785 [Alphaproteobacteria bacterium]|nr:hypothetical protein [Alphaproteobacteria bacterium]